MAIDFRLLAQVALEEARKPLERLRGDASDQARDLFRRYKALTEAVDDTERVLSVERDPARRAALVFDLEHTLPARRDALVAAALAHAGSDLALALDAALTVAVRVLVVAGKALL